MGRKKKRFRLLAAQARVKARQEAIANPVVETENSVVQEQLKEQTETITETKSEPVLNPIPTTLKEDSEPVTKKTRRPRSPTKRTRIKSSK